MLRGEPLSITQGVTVSRYDVTPSLEGRNAAALAYIEGTRASQRLLDSSSAVVGECRSVANVTAHVFVRADLPPSPRLSLFFFARLLSVFCHSVRFASVFVLSLFTSSLMREDVRSIKRTQWHSQIPFTQLVYFYLIKYRTCIKRKKERNALQQRSLSRQ